MLNPESQRFAQFVSVLLKIEKNGNHGDNGTKWYIVPLNVV